MNPRFNATLELTWFPLGNRLNGMRGWRTALRFFAPTSTSRFLTRSPHRRVPTDSKLVAGMSTGG